MANYAWKKDTKIVWNILIQLEENYKNKDKDNGLSFYKSLTKLKNFTLTPIDDTNWYEEDVFEKQTNAINDLRINSEKIVSAAEIISVELSSMELKKIKKLPLNLKQTEAKMAKIDKKDENVPWFFVVSDSTNPNQQKYYPAIDYGEEIIKMIHDTMDENFEEIKK